MKRFVLCLLVVMLCIPGLFACVSRQKYLASVNEMKNLDGVVRDLRERMKTRDKHADSFKKRAEFAELELGRIKAKSRLQRESYEDLLAKFQDLKNRVGDLPTGVTMFQTDEGYGFRVEGEILFASGKFGLKEEGKKTLLMLAEKLGTGAEKIRVDGHTDSDPVVVHKKDFPKGNLELSIRRALEVGHFLKTQGNITEERLSVAGFGMQRPRADNSSPEGKKLNRRVEILILPAD